MSRQYICNKCGKTFDIWDTQEHFHIYVDCGYGTQHDGSRIELDLCCSCMETLVAECKINPVIER